MYRLSWVLVFSLTLLTKLAVGQNKENPHGQGFKMDCASCHSPESWEIPKINWDHSETGFELSGQHKSLNCADCHGALNFSQAASNCSSCHNDVHEGTVGNDCNRCHTTAHWLVTDMQSIHEQNGFPLDGAHFTAGCVECHNRANELVFERIGTDCAQCHSQDFLTTTDPNHQTSGFGMDCASCHDPLATSWAGSGQFHLFFPLEGGHHGLTCIECHDNADYSGASPECSSCHLDDFNGTTMPDHQAIGFSTDCASCHDPMTNDWTTDGSFHHFFPLEDGHSGLSCTECHDNPDYSGASPVCSSCHMDDFNATNDPDHVASGFPTDCALCHDNSSSWSPATFTNHDAQYFPIFSGNHRNEWDNCTECHTTPGNFALFSCIDCHEHNDQNDLADEHDDVSGYVFQSTACYQCHPDGDE